MTSKIKELILQQKFDAALKGQARTNRPYCKFEFGHLYVGTQSLHRTVASKRFRLLLRFKCM